MCVVSMIGDDWRRNFPNSYPTFPSVKYITQEEFIAYCAKNEQTITELRSEIESLKKLLKAAKEFDAATGQPDCEVDEKVDFIKKLAALLGVDMEDIFG